MLSHKGRLKLIRNPGLEKVKRPFPSYVKQQIFFRPSPPLIILVQSQKYATNLETVY